MCVQLCVIDDLIRATPTVESFFAKQNRWPKTLEAIDVQRGEEEEEEEEALSFFRCVFFSTLCICVRAYYV
jgi:hypothetical protein